MLEIIFDKDSTDQKKRIATSILIEIVAPEILEAVI